MDTNVKHSSGSSGKNYKNKNKKKFRDARKNQTKLGERFNISAKKVGKILIENKLKDNITKEVTEKSLSDASATLIPTTRDVTHIYIGSINKIIPLSEEEYTGISDLDFYVIKALKTFECVKKLDEEGRHKLACMCLEELYYDTPKEIREEVEKIVNRKL